MSAGPVGSDGLRAREREHLHAARGGRPLEAAVAASLIAKLGRTRLAWNLSTLHRRADSFDEVCEGFAVLHAIVERVRAERDEARALARHARALERELHRVKAQRDEYRQAARDADGQRLSLLRQLERTGMNSR